MNKILILLICASAFAFRSAAQKPMTYKDLAPKSLKKYALGMPLDRFQKKNPSLKPTDDFDFRIVYNIPNPAAGIKHLILYFDAEEEKPLYELIIEYPDAAARDAFTAKNYGLPNNGKEWKWTLTDGLNARAWVFMNKVVVTVLYPGTEHAK
jgi:hypothetical protein